MRSEGILAGGNVAKRAQKRLKKGLGVAKQPPYINWYTEKAILEIREATAAFLLDVAFEVEAEAKVQVTNNGQVDTGFMRSSIYAVGEGGNSYADARADAESRLSERGEAEREFGDQMDHVEGGASVAVGAEYGIYQEMQNSYLYKALEEVAARYNGATVKVEEYL